MENSCKDFPIRAYPRNPRYVLAFPPNATDLLVFCALHVCPRRGLSRFSISAILAILAFPAILMTASVKIFLPMKAYVTVMLKTTVLDPQGKTIHGALKKMGYKGVGAVRQGKFFELNMDGLDKSAAKAEVERIAKEVLTNPVIEEFSYRIEEKE